MSHISEALIKLTEERTEMDLCKNTKCRFFDSDEHSNCSLTDVKISNKGQCEQFKTRGTTKITKPSKQTNKNKSEPNFYWDENSHSYKRSPK